MLVQTHMTPTSAAESHTSYHFSTSMTNLNDEGQNFSHKAEGRKWSYKLLKAPMFQFGSS